MRWQANVVSRVSVAVWARDSLRSLVCLWDGLKCQRMSLSSNSLVLPSKWLTLQHWSQLLHSVASPLQCLPSSNRFRMMVPRGQIVVFLVGGVTVFHGLIGCSTLSAAADVFLVLFAVSTLGAGALGAAKIACSQRMALWSVVPFWRKGCGP